MRDLSCMMCGHVAGYVDQGTFSPAAIAPRQLVDDKAEARKPARQGAPDQVAPVLAIPVERLIKASEPGEKTKRPPGRPPKITPEIEAVICEQHAAGAKCRELAEQFGVHRNTITRVLRTRGLGTSIDDVMANWIRGLQADVLKAERRLAESRASLQAAIVTREAWRQRQSMSSTGS